MSSVNVSIMIWLAVSLNALPVAFAEVFKCQESAGVGVFTLIAFLATHVRFLFGNVWYLQKRYPSIDGPPDKNQPQKIEYLDLRKCFVTDQFVIVFQGVVFIALAFLIDQAVLFVCVYAIFMLADALWLGWNIKKDVRISRTNSSLTTPDAECAGYGIWVPSYQLSPVKWCCNNALTFLVLAFLLFSIGVAQETKILVPLALAACIGNSVIDMMSTHCSYFSLEKA